MRRRIAAVALALSLYLVPFQDTQAATPRQGTAKHYSPGVMERVAAKRGLPVLRRMASVPDCGRIGWWVYATVHGHTDRYLVVDCSAPKDRPRHLRTGLVIEVNYGSKVAYFPRGEGRTAATVWGFAKSPYKARPLY